MDLDIQMPSTRTRNGRPPPDYDPLSEFDGEWGVDLDDLPDDIAELAAEVDNPKDGFFGPGSVMWKVNQENALFLAGVSAVLLQVAHPMVSAAGVEHSDFDEDLFGRFETTFDIVDTILISI
ncbi:MAG: oxygenase MpaB family protein [Halobacteria archaeon]|nr:oxygenase MpaB family protein [Halobacteria archaeon]